MIKRATSKYVRISPFKARELTRLIQNKSVQEALSILQFSPRRGARLVAKTLNSAIANAESDPDNPISRDELYVQLAVVGEGPTMKRIRTKARGMAGRIRRRTSHITVEVASYE